MTSCPLSIEDAKHLQLCKGNQKYHEKINDQVYKITQRQKKYPSNLTATRVTSRTSSLHFNALVLLPPSPASFSP